MIEKFSSLNPVLQALLATLMTWGFTAAGALPVLFTKALNQKLLDGALGFASGATSAAIRFPPLQHAAAQPRPDGALVLDPSKRLRARRLAR